MPMHSLPELPIAVLDALPNPVLVKDAETRYVWVNQAFERLFGVCRADVVGQLDADLFRERQATQCNGGDLRVLANGEVDEAEETMFDPELGPRQAITRKSRLTVGDDHYLVGVMHDVTDVVVANRQLTEASYALKEQAEELHRLATVDSLTGCLNRRALFDVADRTITGKAAPVGLIVLDLDHFKAVNDGHGHSGGDAVLVQFVEIIAAQLRPEDVIARLGGEEFAVLLPGATLEHTRGVGERICAAVRDTPAVYDDRSISFTVSAGGVHADDGSVSVLDELITSADERLYEAKRLGRDGVVVGAIAKS